MGVSWREYEKDQEAHLSRAAKYHRRGLEPSRAWTAQEERRALRAKFFQEKGRFPTKAQQLRMRFDAR